jgi:hypothetical protein
LHYFRHAKGNREQYADVGGHILWRMPRYHN